MRAPPRTAVSRLPPGMLLVCAVMCGLPTATSIAATGYGYKRAEDPLVLGIKRIVLHARKKEWSSVRKEFGRLDWQFEEFKKDLDVDIAERFEKAIDKQELAALSPEICRVMYFALLQKFHWNRREGCKKYVPAKSRTEAALFYYEEILSIGTRDFDTKNDSRHHEMILKDFKTLRQSVGTAGLFGIGARPPDVEAFTEASERILRRLRKVYVYLPEPEDAKEGSAPAKEREEESKG